MTDLVLCRSADLALSEANTLDPENPEVWGQLALLSLLQGKLDEADIVSPHLCTTEHVISSCLHELCRLDRSKYHQVGSDIPIMHRYQCGRETCSEYL